MGCDGGGSAGAVDRWARVGSAGSVGVRVVAVSCAEGVGGDAGGAVVSGGYDPADGVGVEDEGEDGPGDSGDPGDPGEPDPEPRESPGRGLGLGTVTTAESPLPSPLPTSRSNPFPLCRASTRGIFVIGPWLSGRGTTTVTSTTAKPVHRSPLYVEALRSMSSGFSSGLPQLHFTDGCPYPSTSTAMPACSTDR